MFDGLVLQIVLCVVFFSVAAVAVVWFIAGITEKSAVWIITYAMPFALIAAVIVALVTA